MIKHVTNTDVQKESKGPITRVDEAMVRVTKMACDKFSLESGDHFSLNF
jgi:hypothetical protein